jgi:hypothetical protein
VDTTTGTGRMFILLIGEYGETTILGVTCAAGQGEADRVAALFTAERAAGYIVESGPLAGARSYHPRDLIAVRAEPVEVFAENAGRVVAVEQTHREHTGRWNDTGEVTR